MSRSRLAAAAFLLSCAAPAMAQAPAPSPASSAKAYQVEWVYRVKYGFQEEWWRLFQTYQIAALDEEQRRGYVQTYTVVRPGLHTSEDSRWDYRIVITYSNWDGAQHEDEVLHALFKDRDALKQAEKRRWELTLNHWDLPIHQIDPHAPAE